MEEQRRKSIEQKEALWKFQEGVKGRTFQKMEDQQKIHQAMEVTRRSLSRQ